MACVRVLRAAADTAIPRSREHIADLPALPR